MYQNKIKTEMNDSRAVRERQKEVKMKLGNFSVREYAILASSSCVEIRGAGG